MLKVRTVSCLSIVMFYYIFVVDLTCYDPSLFVPTGKLYGNVDFVEERHRHRYEVN